MNDLSKFKVTRSMPREEFARWANYEVALKENAWVKLTPDRYREPA